ncbi:AAA family ATPase [Niabella ginsenosidivorans]|uniref:AAA family ATPase n=1 Tax=Niabella ginsenosidivorans TaxID=1176587 RepID=A0A1A9I4T3_9BACT|nr:AAA family ATPase [Niabella ginsenosidivorans]ANH81564.1 AAA family ATPase [Niabella ginsenosidivorans]
MEQESIQKVINTNELFGDAFINAKVLYLHEFGKLPCTLFIGQLDGSKAFTALKELLAGRTRHIFQRQWFKRKNKKFQYDTAIFLLNDGCILELDEYWCEILHDGNNDLLIREIVHLLQQFHEKKKKEPLEINLIVRDGNRLLLKSMEIKRNRLDLDLFYEDDFKAVDSCIRQRLNRKKDKGIVLLHGLPGTGKTSYLRYLVGKIRKRVLFLSPSVAGNLISPDFIQLLINNPDTVLIIEDAENIIMDRRYSSGSSVSDLLNISDGLLADFLNIQLICTFNSALTLIDEALLREGRLIAKYEFRKLSVEKARALACHLGYPQNITEPSTLAEICNFEPVAGKQAKPAPIGFRLATS